MGRKMRNSSRRRGVTRVEALIGSAILALGVGGYQLYAGSANAHEDTQEAKTRAAAIQTAVQAWQQNGERGCPSVSQLVHDSLLEAEARVDDPWGENYRVFCDGESVTVFSPGPDGERDTHDDIRVGS